MPQNTKYHHKLSFDFAENKITAVLFGVANENLLYIESILGVELFNKGNQIMIASQNSNDAKICLQALMNLYEFIKTNKDLTRPDIDYQINLARQSEQWGNMDRILLIRKNQIRLRNINQAKFIHEMQQKDLVFGVGPAGTGKTFLAVAYGVSLLLSGAVEKLILTRPAVEAGENLGFLPGDYQEKVSPYLRPIYDILDELLAPNEFQKMRDSGQIQIAPLAYMRGRTLKNAFILLDEAQNTRKMQMKMFLTRLGDYSKMVVNGDPTQTDLEKPHLSGLEDAITRLRHLSEIGVCEFNADDITRHPLVMKIVKAYD